MYMCATACVGMCVTLGCEYASVSQCTIFTHGMMMVEFSTFVLVLMVRVCLV